MRRLRPLFIVTLSVALVLSSCAQAPTIPISVTPSPDKNYIGSSVGVKMGLMTDHLPAGLGMKVDRVQCQWMRIEPYEDPSKAVQYRAANPKLAKYLADPSEIDANGFDWSYTDRVTKDAEASNVEVIFTLRAVSTWGTVNGVTQTGGYLSASMPKDINRWARFVETMATRYANRSVPISYEIENEINANEFWSGTSEQYAEHLKVSYDAVKRGDPKAPVIMSAMACGITKDMQVATISIGENNLKSNMISGLMTGAFDKVAIHDYYFTDHIVNGYTFQSYLEAMHKIMSENGAGGEPIVVTEFGYVTVPTKVGRRMDDGSEANQALWMRQAYTQASQVSNVEVLIWLLLQDRNEPYFGTMGLEDAQGKKREAYWVYRELAAKLSTK